jgi:hypothetical protein
LITPNSHSISADVTPLPMPLRLPAPFLKGQNSHRDAIYNSSVGGPQFLYKISRRSMMLINIRKSPGVEFNKEEKSLVDKFVALLSLAGRSATAKGRSNRREDRRA